MLKKENVLVLIPARAGSKGVKNKNSKAFAGGESLTERTIQLALKVFHPQQIVLSTDDVNLFALASKYQIILIKRSAELANDTAGMQPVMQDAVNQLGSNYSHLLLLQPTSPFRQAKHITDALEKYQTSDKVLVAVHITESHPYYTLFCAKDAYIEKFSETKAIRRQDLPEMYDVNGLLYIFDLQHLFDKPWTDQTEIRPLVVKKWESLDIDTEDDWWIAESLMKNLRSQFRSLS